MAEVLIAAGAAFAAAVLLTGWMRRFALSRQLLDTPNPRSSHIRPTPRGGGVAIVVVVLLAVIIFPSGGDAAASSRWAFLGAGALVAAVGWLEDRGHVRASARLLVHFAAAIWGVTFLGGLPPLEIFGSLVDLGLPGDVLAVVLLVWLLNLYNFMDGIDGIAGIEAMTVGFGAGLLYHFRSAAVDFLPWVVAAAAAGFLVWNFPRARIFMGDAGSGFTGLILGLLAVDAASVAPELFWAWLILLGAFVVDASVTLVRRIARRERVYEAHRSHAYQRMARRAGSHVPVSLAFAGINILWLLPIAYAVASGALAGLTGALIAYGPLTVLAWGLGAGRDDADAVTPPGIGLPV